MTETTITATVIETKLTMISVIVRGRRVTRFVKAKIVNEKAVVSITVLEDIAEEAAGTPLWRGQTISVG